MTMNLRLGLILSLLSLSGNAKEFVIVIPEAPRSVLVADLKSRGLEFVEYLDFAKRYARVRSQPNSTPETLGFAAEENIIYRSMGGSSPPKEEPPVVSHPPRADEPELATWLPRDPRFNSLWGLHNTQNPRRDIQAPAAWAVTRTRGLRDVVVGVVDTGLDFRHPDLVNQLWSNPQIPGTFGFNAINGTTQIMDDNFHGTHVAGTIAATQDNGIGVAGLAPNARIMSLKFLNSSGQGTLADAIKAIDWARQNGAQVLNNSWGGGPYSKLLEETIARAGEDGILFVAAAGNESNDNDERPSYPASYKLPNVIAVAATNSSDQLSDFSNYGQQSVHIAAPGDAIMSTVPNNSYRSLRGTSMASPHVAAAAALLLGLEPNLSPLQIRTRLQDSAEKIPSLVGRVQTGSGRLNIYNAVVKRIPEDPTRIPEELWSPAEETLLETPHPYPPQKKWTWRVESRPDQKIRVRLLRMQTKNETDALILRDSKGQIRQIFRGLYTRPQWSVPIQGPTLNLEFQSSRGDEYGYGFQIDSLQRTR